MTIAQVLSAERERQGVSIRELARLSDMGARRIQGILDGEVENPGILTVQKILKAFGKSLSWLDKRLKDG